MIPLLEKAFEEISKLPEDEQAAFAAMILAELESEKRWNDLLSESDEMLSELADEALKEHHASKTKARRLYD